MATTQLARRVVSPRDVVVGAGAGLVAWIGMAGWALLALAVGGFGASATPAAMALAVGGSAGVAQDLGRMQVDGSISALPLGVSVIGAVLLTALLTTWARVAGAAATFLVGLVVTAFLPAGQLDVHAGPTLVGGLCWLAVVLTLRVAMWWLPQVRNVVLILLGAAGVATLIGALAAIWGGARVLGTMLLAAPNLLCVALTRGLGVPWQVRGPDLPLPTLDTGALGPIDAPMWPLAVLAAGLVLLLAVATRWHAIWVTAVLFGALALLGGAALNLRAGFFTIELGVSGDVLVATGVGLAGGLVASLLVAAFRYWQGHRT